jgi:hypothetical protein
MKKLVYSTGMVMMFFSFQACQEQEVQPYDITQDQLVNSVADKSDLFDTDENANKRVINYVAHLSGDHEVPPVESTAAGQVKFQLNHDGSSLYYKLIVANIENVRFAHIHLASEGNNGPVVVTLYPGPTLEKVNGILAEGNIMSADLSGPLAGMSLSSLIDEINNSMTYVNVHTDQVPSGELRGQIM